MSFLRPSLPAPQVRSSKEGKVHPKPQRRADTPRRRTLETSRARKRRIRVLGRGSLTRFQQGSASRFEASAPLPCMSARPGWAATRERESPWRPPCAMFHTSKPARNCVSGSMDTRRTNRRRRLSLLQRFPPNGHVAVRTLNAGRLHMGKTMGAAGLRRTVQACDPRRERSRGHRHSWRLTFTGPVSPCD